MAFNERPPPTATLPELEERYGAIPVAVGNSIELDPQNGRFTEAHLFDEPIPPVACAISLLLPLGVPTLLVGPGGVGKSTLLALLAICICIGRKFGDLMVIPGAVVIISLEDSRDQYRRRLRTIADSLALTLVEKKLLAERIFVYDAIDLGLHLTRGSHSRLEINREAIDVITRLCEQIGDVSVVAFETVSRFFRGGDENGNSDAAVFIEAASTLALYTNAAVLLTHHTGKTKNRKQMDSHSARGASALTDNARSVMNLEPIRYRDKEAPKGIGKTEFEEYRVLRLDHTKANLTQRASSYMFHLRAGEHGPYLALVNQSPRTTADRARDGESQLAADVQKIVEFISDNPGHYTKNALEIGSYFDFGRMRLRAAIEKAHDDGLIDDRPVPQEKRRGGRKTYLAVTDANSN